MEQGIVEGNGWQERVTQERDEGGGLHERVMQERVVGAGLQERVEGGGLHERMQERVVDGGWHAHVRQECVVKASSEEQGTFEGHGLRVDGGASGLEAHASVRDLNERGPDMVEDNMLDQLMERIQMLERGHEENMAAMLRNQAWHRESGGSCVETTRILKEAAALATVAASIYRDVAGARSPVRDDVKLRLPWGRGASAYGGLVRTCIST